MNSSFQHRLDHHDIFIIVELTEKNLKKRIFMKIRLFGFYEIFKLLSRPQKLTFLNEPKFIS